MSRRRALHWTASFLLFSGVWLKLTQSAMEKFTLWLQKSTLVTKGSPTRIPWASNFSRTTHQLQLSPLKGMWFSEGSGFPNLLWLNYNLQEPVWKITRFENVVLIQGSVFLLLCVSSYDNRLTCRGTDGVCRGGCWWGGVVMVWWGVCTTLKTGSWNNLGLLCPVMFHFSFYDSRLLAAESLIPCKIWEYL